MTWHQSLNEAAEIAFENAKKHGAHAFYFPRKGFLIKRDSKNGTFAGDSIATNPSNYVGFFRKLRRKDIDLTLEDIIEELVYAQARLDTESVVRSNRSSLTAKVSAKSITGNGLSLCRIQTHTQRL